VNSEAEMKTMSTKMTSTFSDSKKFTNEMQKAMTTNNVESVSSNTITADTSAAPSYAGTLGTNNAINNDKTPKSAPHDKINPGVIAAALLVPLLVIAAVVSAVVWYRRKKPSTYDTTPSIELFEKRGSVNSINPLENHANVVLPEQVLEARPDAFLSQPPPPPQQRTKSIEAINKGMVYKNAMKRTAPPLPAGSTKTKTKSIRFSIDANSRQQF
jgi:hypothetical protein